ncbi:ABC transporter [Streptomyces clavuligerus]|nr:ABC transporter [Streptomyces clavuligerus]
MMGIGEARRPAAGGREPATREALRMTAAGIPRAGRGPIVEVGGLREAYGGRTAVEDVPFTVEEGEIFGVLGLNGAGRTTTVECVAGLRVPDAGRVRVAGLDPVADRADATGVLGVQLQESALQTKLTTPNSSSRQGRRASSRSADGRRRRSTTPSPRA